MTTYGAPQSEQEASYLAETDPTLDGRIDWRMSTDMASTT